MDSGNFQDPPAKRPRGRPRKAAAPAPEVDTTTYASTLKSKLRPIQNDIYAFIRSSDKTRTVINAHRGLGKSYLCCIVALEEAMQNPNISVKLISPTQKMTRAIVQPIMREILSDCPEDLKPKFRFMDGLYEFPNGSTLLTAGSDLGQADALRGTTTHFVVYDEAGFMDHLEYIHTSVISPRLLPVGGKAVFISTPPVSPVHYFAKLISQAEAGGYLHTYSVRDNAHIDANLLAAFVEECGGETTTAFRREFLCEVITDDKFALFPELVRGEAHVRRDSDFLSRYFSAKKSVVSVFFDFNNETSVAELISTEIGLFVKRVRSFRNTSIGEVIAAFDSATLRESVAFSANGTDTPEAATRNGKVYFIPTQVDAAQDGVSFIRDILSSGGIVCSEEAYDAVSKELSYAVFDASRKNIATIDGYRFPLARAIMAAAKYHCGLHGINRGNPKGFKTAKLWNNINSGVRAGKTQTKRNIIR